MFRSENPEFRAPCYRIEPTVGTRPHGFEGPRINSIYIYIIDVLGAPCEEQQQDRFIRVLARQCSDGFLDRVDGLHDEAAAVMTVRMHLLQVPLQALEVGQGHIQQAPPLGALGGGT